jgi:hypothetical protein
MRYQVEFVSDDSLPAGVEWAFARTLGETYLFVKRSAIEATQEGRDDVLCRAWTAWQATHPPVHALT